MYYFILSSYNISGLLSLPHTFSLYFQNQDETEDVPQDNDDTPGESGTAKNKLRGIIRKGIFQRKAARRFARKNIQFIENVDVYTRTKSMDELGTIRV